MWNDVIELGKSIESIEFSEVIKKIEWREVFANKKSIKQSEFYQAATIGLKPEILFEVYSVEFNDDEKVRYNGKEYSILRTYDKGEITELTVTRFGGEGDLNS